MDIGQVDSHRAARTDRKAKSLKDEFLRNCCTWRSKDQSRDYGVKEFKRRKCYRKGEAHQRVEFAERSLKLKTKIQPGLSNMSIICCLHKHHFRGFV